jgi:hypothetical protein
MPIKDKAKYNAYMREYRRKQKQPLIVPPTSPTTLWGWVAVSLSQFLQYILKQFKELYYYRRY